MTPMKIKTKEDRRDRIKLRLRKRIVGTADRPRLTVFRSGGHMYVQAVDDAGGRTLAAASTLEPSARAKMGGKVRGNNIAGAQLVGQTIAERLIGQGLKQAVFDRNGFLYHGRIKAVADAARKAGLEF
jgi:large subunit ribosomal protein L18